MLFNIYKFRWSRIGITGWYDEVSIVIAFDYVITGGNWTKVSRVDDIRSWSDGCT
jgi:hypothetical protein